MPTTIIGVDPHKRDMRSRGEPEPATSAPGLTDQRLWSKRTPKRTLQSRHQRHDLQELRPVTSNWLTAQQVQDLLDVDASTVYRMAGNGRLPAVRIGRQWRFPTEAIDALLLPPAVASGSRTALAASTLLPASLATSALEAIAPALRVTMVVTDLGGHPLTEVVNPAPAIAASLNDPGFINECAVEWRSFAEGAHLAPRLQLGRFGFMCAHSLVRCGSTLIGMVLAGGIAPDEDDAPELFHLDTEERRLVLETLPRTAALLSRIADDRARGHHASPSDVNAAKPTAPAPAMPDPT